MSKSKSTTVSTVRIDAALVLKTRKAMDLNQSDFWRPLGITQSGGSRYESGRTIPAPTRKLFFLMYVAGLSGEQFDGVATV